MFAAPHTPPGAGRGRYVPHKPGCAPPPRCVLRLPGLGAAARAPVSDACVLSGLAQGKYKEMCRQMYAPGSVCIDHAHPPVRPAVPKEQLMAQHRKARQAAFDAQRRLSPTPPPLPRRYSITPLPPTQSSNELRRWMGSWRSETHRHHEAALVVQCAFRRHQACKRVDALRLQDLRATAQALRDDDAEARYLAGTPFVMLQGEEVMAVARRAVHVIEQAYSVHRCKVRRREEACRRGRVKDCAVREYAALRVQAAFRGAQARSRQTHLAQRRASQEGFKYNYAVVCSQCTAPACSHLPFVTRRRNSRIAAAVCVLQCACRKLQARRVLELRKEARRMSDLRYHHGLQMRAAAMIQRWWVAHAQTARLRATRRLYHHEVVVCEAAETLQRTLRCFAALQMRRRLTTKRNAQNQDTVASEAAVALQTAARSFLARRHVQRMQVGGRGDQG